jgi:nucleoside-specific outer membrane channel protein Tsx
MLTKRLLPLAALALVLAAPAARALDWSDNAFRFWWGPNFREPGVRAVDGGSGGRDVEKGIVTFTHVDGYKWGGNFLNINLLRSTKADPANRNPGQGATEFYAIYRHDLSLDKVSGTKTFSFGPVRDVLLEAGVDVSTKNTFFAPHKLMPVIGPVVSLDVPGFWTVGVLVNKEWNNNGVVQKSVEFDPTLTFTTAFGVPLFGTPLSLEGFGSVNLPKGKDGFGNETKTEVLLHPKLLWDVGQLFGSKGYQLGAGYEYWLNKFGNDTHAVGTVGAEQSTFFVEAAIHL